MRTGEVMDALRARHSEDRGWVTLEEAFRIDFLALACHGSYRDRTAERRAHGALHPWVGYEVKVSRADFLNEVRRPAKRAWAVGITHEFYFATPAGLVKRSEVPPDCGLVEVHGAGCRVVVESPITAAVAVSHLNLAQMLRHGMRPAWLRYMAERKRMERHKRKCAELAEARMAERLERAKALLGEHARIEVGSSWTGGGAWRRERWTVKEVTDRSVKLVSAEHDYSPRYPVADFLMDFERAA